HGVGRDNISDFTTNLILDYLCVYTQGFCEKYLTESATREIAISNARFNFQAERWQHRNYRLPWVNGDYVILTPKDMLTRDENWINRGDLVRHFESIPIALPDDVLRMQVSNHFHNLLAKHKDREANAE